MKDNNNNVNDLYKNFLKERDNMLNSSVLIKVFSDEMKSAIINNHYPHRGNATFSEKEKDDLLSFVHIKKNLKSPKNSEINTGVDGKILTIKDRYNDDAQIKYTYNNGYFSTKKISTAMLNKLITDKERVGLEAYITTESEPNGRTLLVAVSGDNTNVLEKGNFDELSHHLIPLKLELEKYKKENPDIHTIKISGHHNGAALAKQLFDDMGGKNNPSMKALLLGDTGSIVRDEHIKRDICISKENEKEMVCTIDEFKSDYSILPSVSDMIIPEFVQGQINTLENSGKGGKIAADTINGVIDGTIEAGLGLNPVTKGADIAYKAAGKVLDSTKMAVNTYALLNDKKDKSGMYYFENLENDFKNTGYGMFNVVEKAVWGFDTQVISLELGGDIKVAKEIKNKQLTQYPTYLKSSSEELIYTSDKDNNGLIDSDNNGLKSKYNKYVHLTQEVDERKFTADVYFKSYRNSIGEIANHNKIDRSEFPNSLKLDESNKNSNEVMISLAEKNNKNIYAVMNEATPIISKTGTFNVLNMDKLNAKLDDMLMESQVKKYCPTPYGIVKPF